MNWSWISPPAKSAISPGSERSQPPRWTRALPPCLARAASFRTSKASTQPEEHPMTKYRIAWLPGDGIGQEVCDAARVVLDAAGFEAEYLHGDIGWEFWRREGVALPARTVEPLRTTHCAISSAMTSNPAGEAARELAP